MRPQGRASTESLYFRYPRFDPPETRKSADSGAAVAMVGAGPVGMTAALALAQEGIRTILFDIKDTFNDGSRAICVARSSFNILQRLGVVDRFLDKALGWTTGRTFFRGQQILEFHMPDGPGEKYRPMYNIQQQYIEQFLWDAVAASDLIETRWQTEAVGCDNRNDGVTLTLRDPAGTYTYDAPWVLACDGARSALRRFRGLRLAGENFEGRYVIADIRMDHDYPTIRRALFDPRCRPGGTVLIHRQPDDIWRIDYQLRDGEDEAQATREDIVRQSVQAVLDEIGHGGAWDLEWWSIYSANTLALDDYRDGRVFFVGDSAHIVPIFGVRGLNNGLADAANIGWKLGHVLTGRAGERLLESYTPERRGATLDVFASASRSARFMTPATHGWRLMRDAALSLALRHPFAGDLANPRQMTPYTYAESPAILPDDPAFAAGPVAGAHLPEMRIGDRFVTDLLGPGYTVLVFDPALADMLARQALTIVLCPADSSAARTLAASGQSAYLIRPDNYIAARWYSTEAAAILNALSALADKETQIR